MEIKKQYRPEIEGLRFVAALLVAIYHIWMMRVSGGVDVFFVVSGFLITTSLLSKYARDGYIQFFNFIGGLLKRLLPQAVTVLIFVTVMSYFILPEVRHIDTIKEIFASLFYYENWQLAITGTDYLDQNNAKSPVQHFWAMSIQGQFYLIWFLIISATVIIYTKTKFEMKNILLAILSVLFFISLAYSVYLTEVNQPWAYFDTRTRVWEFAVGGILMIFIFKAKLPAILSTILGWGGLIGLTITGFIMDVGASFPSYIALWPVTAAVFVMLAGQNPTSFGVEKFLGSRPMVYLGGLSYGLYLWHWPILSFYYVIFDTTDVGVVHGVSIILLSLLLSFLTTNFIEKPINGFITSRKLTLRSFTPIIAMAGLLVIITCGWLAYSQFKGSYSMNFAGNEDYPGVMANTEAVESPEPRDPIPGLEGIKNDKAEPYEDGCHVSPGDSEVKICEYGETDDYDYTVALVGGSKSTHWLPSLQSFAEEEAVRVLNVTKSGCRFTLDEVKAEDCMEWNKNVVDQVSKEDPDLLITLADNANKPEKVPGGFLEQFEKADEYGIPVMAIRDTPYLSEDASECLSANGMDTDKCNVDRDETYPDPSAWERLENPPSNVHYADYTDYICGEEECPVVIGNVVVYLDKSHMTATFNETFGPIIRKDVMQILDNIPAKEKSMNNENLIDSGSLISGSWIGYNGETVEDEEMRTTRSIPYDPDKSYEINRSSYVSYFNGDEFIETKLYEEGLPKTIDTVEEADSVKVSFNEYNMNEIELVEK
ncbi:acyltransferase [Salinicoccus sediminis]|uniref:Acyltransferase n=1 Tax=Salinicoccus sediminis TaxID=1432562 RepID=A0A0M2SI55_9STAP|nr:acyltransferase [Salinicoccus sediminis]